MRFWAIILGVFAFPALAQTFLPGTEDIPLMDGLTQVEETASFDNPAERMVLVEAQTKLPPKKVSQFYKETLTNLGWTEKKTNTFERGNDSFSIDIISSEKTSQIQFRLSQRNP